jgi:N-[(2S)-2-amino-2-carboxyethyl]-L-glutamate dehydrogenase
MSEFDVVAGQAVKQIIDDAGLQILQVVEDAYLRHDAGRTVNPDSYFLRFPDKPDSRIIALPAFIELDGAAVAGLKWISSFPGNVASNAPRASAVLVLNDYATGRPIALLEAANISAARTAASAAIAARAIAAQLPPSGPVAIVGAGVIARTIVQYLVLADYPIERLVIYDLDRSSAERLAGIAEAELGLTPALATSLAEAMAAQTVVLATTAGVPYIDLPLRPGQVVLNISLRDLKPELLLAAENYFDDVEHCMKAETSPHLAERLSGGRRFVTGTLADLLQGRRLPTGDRAVVFSPFGLGVLDLAVGHFVLSAALAKGLTSPIPNFFGETRRW